MKKILIITGIFAAMAALIFVALPQKSTADPRGDGYAGSAACVKCHSNISNSYLHTSHYMASSLAKANTIQGSFANGLNVFNINASQKVVMEKHKDGMYQTYYLNGKPQGSHRFDIVFGGVKGQSYLYWKGNELYQLPLSYYSREHQWSTSPGYGFSFVDFRSIGIRCLECHASYISQLPQEKNQLTGNEQFDKKTLVYGIDCERCHGPGAQHADFQAANPAVKTSRFITTFASLTRGQKIDMCAVCHSGIHKTLVRSTFGFMPGDTFAKFKVPEFQQQVDTTHIDVHGKQVQLLQSSKCYQYSKMDCSTCHDTHQNTRGNVNLFAVKCLTCHNAPGHVFCKITAQLSTSALKANCISCHMPQQTTKVISVQLADKAPPTRFFVHTHHIAIYGQDTKKVLAYINKHIAQ